MGFELDEPQAPTTIPPPSPVARALRAIGRNLDAIGRGLGILNAKASGLAEMGKGDHAEQKATLSRIEGKLDLALAALVRNDARTGDLEQWRGEHERQHARQQ